MKNELTTTPITSKSKRIYIIAAIAIIIVACLGYWYWTRTPQYSLKIIQESVSKHDLQTFEKHVDIDSVSSRLIDQVLDAKINDKSEVQDETVKNFAMGFIQMLKPQLVAMAKEQIRSFVEKGKVESSAQQAQNNNTPKFSVEDLYKGNSGNEKVEFKGIDYVNKDGKIAIVGLKLFYPKLNSELILEVKMRDLDGYWQVAEINNIASFLNKLEEIESKKLAEVNQPVIDNMNAAVKVNSITMTPFNKNAYSKAVTFQTNLTFASQKIISEIGGTILVKNQEGKLLLKFPVRASGSATPGATRNITWTKDINPFISSDIALFNTPTTQLNMALNTDYLKFSDGTELKLADKLP